MKDLEPINKFVTIIHHISSSQLLVHLIILSRMKYLIDETSVKIASQIILIFYQCFMIEFILNDRNDYLSFIALLLLINSHTLSDEMFELRNLEIFFEIHKMFVK